MTIKTRQVTEKILEAVSEGMLTWEIVAMAALSYMSEDEVADMAVSNEFFLYDEEDDDEEEE
jgi:hypothetical protein